MSKQTPAAGKACPICGRLADARFRPFCSRRCKDVDLHRWLAGAYVVPGAEADSEEMPSPRLAPDAD